LFLEIATAHQVDLKSFANFSFTPQIGQALLFSDPLSTISFPPFHHHPVDLSCQLKMGAEPIDLKGEHEYVDQLDDRSDEQYDQEEKALVRKIDLYLLPTIWLMYLLSCKHSWYSPMRSRC
jgi:hypothetical protein